MTTQLSISLRDKRVWEGTRRMPRWYDTVDVSSSRATAINCGLEHIGDNDLGDQHEIGLLGTIPQHEAFMKAEGYSNTDWRSGKQ